MAIQTHKMFSVLTSKKWNLTKPIYMHGQASEVTFIEFNVAYSWVGMHRIAAYCYQLANTA